MTSAINRRQFVKAAGAGIAAALTSAKPLVGGTPESVLSVDPTPRFDLSPYLFMQFMEPLGTTDGSVAAAWDFKTNRWRPDVIQATQELAPTMIRWGGCFSSYYRWKEAVGPRDQRTPMINLLWGGIETNQVGTAEFVNFCPGWDRGVRKFLPPGQGGSADERKLRIRRTQGLDERPLW
jgi:hypothetical protein